MIHITYISNILKLIFEDYEKYFFTFLSKKKTKNKTKTKKSFENKHVKDVKTFLKKKKKKSKKRPETNIRIFLKKKKKNSMSIIAIELNLCLLRKCSLSKN